MTEFSFTLRISFLLLCLFFFDAATSRLVNDAPFRSLRNYRRDEGGKSYVILPTTFTPINLGNEVVEQVVTEVQIGYTRQTLKLKVSTGPVTWVPLEPESVDAFCKKEVASCRIARFSGYYRPKNIDPAAQSENEVSLGEGIGKGPGSMMASGLWIKDTISAEGAVVNNQIVAAKSWKSQPLLGLGLQEQYPTHKDKMNISKEAYSSRYPGYLKALTDGKKISTGQVISFYNIMNPKSRGEIIVGGIDRNKFYGEFYIEHRARFPGAIRTPITRLMTKGNAFDPIGINDRGSAETMAVIDPEATGIYVPNEIRKLVENLLRPFNVFTTYDIEFPGSLLILQCGVDIPADYSIIFSFNYELEIRIPLKNLLLSTPTANSGSGCPMALYSIDILQNYHPSGANEFSNKVGRHDVNTTFSYVFGGAFFNAAYVVIGADTGQTAIAPSKPNVTRRDIVPIGSDIFIPLSGISGDPMPPPSPDFEEPGIAKVPSTNVIVGVTIAGIAVLVSTIALGIWAFRSIRRSQMENMPEIPDIPSPVPYPYELNPDSRAAKEMGTIGDISAEVPGQREIQEMSSNWIPELEGAAGKLNH